MKEAFLFYRSFADAANNLEDADRLAVYDALMAYALDGVEPAKGGIVGAMFALMRPVLDSSSKRHEANAENGKRGGRPKRTEEEPNSNPSESENNPTETQKNPSESEGNPNETEPKANQKLDKGQGIKDKGLKESAPKGAQKKSSAEPRHAHGQYKHVLLSDHELARLDDEFGHEATKDAIRILDEYCQLSGKRYRDYNLALRKWPMEEARKTARSGTKANSFTAINANVYDFSALERELVENGA